MQELKSNVVYRKATEPFDSRRFIHEAITQTFSERDLRSLIFKIAETERFKSYGRIDEIAGMTYDGLPGEGKSDTALELVLFMRRHGRYSDLLRWLKRERDGEDWDQFDKKL